MCIISIYISLYRDSIFYWGSILRKTFQNIKIWGFVGRKISGNESNVSLYRLCIGVFFMKSSVKYNLMCIFLWLRVHLPPVSTELVLTHRQDSNAYAIYTTRVSNVMKVCRPFKSKSPFQSFCNMWKVITCLLRHTKYMILISFICI